ncbi:MAG: carboxypeptidase regulatory-like domain-containing protein [Gemmatimonadaceae bacterium]
MHKSSVRGAVVAMTVALLAATLPARMRAQELRGTVVQSDGVTPASGAVVLMLHASKDSILARIVTGERGLYTLKAPRPMSVRLRVLRLGYQPTNVGTYTLAVGQTETVRVKLGDQRIVLARFDVKAGNRCDVKPDSALLVAQLFEEARKALLASASPVSNVRNAAQFTLFTRAQDVRGKLTAPIQRSTFTGPSSRPFASLSADSLAKVGYMLEEEDGTVYRAPDADVLLSDVFLANHCLQFVQGTAERAAFVGIGFRAVNRVPTFVDVRGTLWLDRETSELQFLEYQYDGVPDQYTKMNVGGRVDYTQMAAGMWFVNKWAIRMPRFVARSNQRLPGMRVDGMLNAADLAGLQITGGEVQSVKVDDEVLYSNAGASLVGGEPRDLQDLKVLQGQFDVAAEAQSILVAKPVTSIDSVFSMSACTDAASADYRGQVQGRVRDADNKKFESVPVIAEWKEDFKLSGQRDFTWQYRRLETRTNANGSYSMCGLPLSRAVTLTATNKGRKSRVATIRVTDRIPRTSMDLSIGENVGTVLSAADINGKGAILVVRDLIGKPVPYAVIATNGATNRIADEEGRVVIPSAPRDSLQVFVRRMGYTAFDGIARRDSTGVFVLTMAPNNKTLATVNVRERQNDMLSRTGFYDRVKMSQRGAVLGDFLTPEQLETRPATKMTQLLQGSRYVTVRGGKGGFSVLYGRAGCPMNVVVDGVAMKNFVQDTETEKRSNGTLAVDDLVGSSEIVAIEIYPTMTSAPSAISSLIFNSSCGIVAIWTGAR